MSSLKFLILSLLPSVLAQETVYGVYMFHRHGDRVAKSTPPTVLTQLGYQEVYTSGLYYRNRYVADGAQYKIHGLNSDIVAPSQLYVAAPSDTVLQSSAEGFLQGLYPAVTPDAETLRNGTVIYPPLNGYQLIPVALVEAGTGSESSGWLQDASGCSNAEISSNNFFFSAEYTQLLNSTQAFYTNLEPVINNTFTAAQTSFKNAYTIFDLINVAEIHNATINDDQLLDNNTLFQLRTLADTHEWGLAYNASDDLRAMQGMQLAGEILSSFNTTINTNGTVPLNIQFGAYATFFSFFGISNLTAASPDFYGIPDYASVMIFELFTNGTNSTGFPSKDDLQVRFLFHNGTTSNISDPTVFPLFGGTATSLSWTDFYNAMSNISVTSTQQWCQMCGNTTGTCAAYANNTSSSSTSSGNSTSSSSGHHMSAAVGGVIGAFVTLAVILGLEALIMLLGGLRLVSKSRLAGAPNDAAVAAK